MKLLILSDSHGRVREMESAVRAECPDAVMHLGDCVRDAEALRAAFPALVLYAVAGNCDPRGSASEARLFELDGIKIYMTHGHIYNVKMGLERMYYAACEKGARVALFGHTHRPVQIERGGLLLLNPGSIGSAPRRSYAVVDTGQITARHMYID